MVKRKWKNEVELVKFGAAFVGEGVIFFEVLHLVAAARRRRRGAGAAGRWSGGGGGLRFRENGRNTHKMGPYF